MDSLPQNNLKKSYDMVLVLLDQINKSDIIVQMAL